MMISTLEQNCTPAADLKHTGNHWGPHQFLFMTHGKQLRPWVSRGGLRVMDPLTREQHHSTVRSSEI